MFKIKIMSYILIKKYNYKKTEKILICLKIIININLYSISILKYSFFSNVLTTLSLNYYYFK